MVDVIDYIESCDDPWDLKRIGKNPKIVRVIENYIGKAGNVIDIGGGYGFYADSLRHFGNRVTVIDKSKKMISDGSRMFPLINFVEGDATDMPFVKDTFNAAVCMGTLMYINNKGKFFSELHRILKPKGLCFLYERNKYDILNIIIRLFKKTEKFVDKPNMFLNKNEIKSLAMEYGFNIRKIKGTCGTFLFFLLVKK